MMVLVLPSVLWMIFKATGAAETLDFDLGEKRNKHEITLSRSGANLTSELEAWYNDRVPFRSIILKAEGAISNAIEAPYEKLIEPALIAAVNKKMNQDAQADASQSSSADDVSVIGTSDGTEAGTADGSTVEGSGQPENTADGAEDPSVQAGTEETQTGTENAQAGTENGQTEGGPVEGAQDETVADATAAPAVSTEEVPSDGTQGPSDTGFFPYKELSPDVIRGRDNWLFYTGTLADYTGTNLVTEGELAYEAQILTELRDYFRANGTEVYYIVAPNKSSMYSEFMPTLDQAPVRRAQIAEQYMQANTDLYYNYLYDEMLPGKSSHQLYYRLDTHWNAYGALEAADVLHAMFGLPPIDRSQLIENSFVFDNPDLVAMSGTAGDYGTDVSYDLNYNVYVTPTQVVNWTEDGTYFEYITPDAPYEGTLVVLGDSFRIGLLGYLPRDYTHVVFIDQLANWSDYWGTILGANKIVIEEAERNEYFFVGFVESIISYIYS